MIPSLASHLKWAWIIDFESEKRETANGAYLVPQYLSLSIVSVSAAMYLRRIPWNPLAHRKQWKKSGAEQAASNRFVSRSPALDTTKQSRWVPIIIASQKESSWAADKRCALLWIPRMRNRIRNWIQIEIRGVCCHCLFMTVYCQC